LPNTFDFKDHALRHPPNAALLRRLAPLNLNQCHLTAGCLFQTVWNHQSGNPLDFGIKDYDVFYYEDTDLSWEAEDKVIKTVHAATADLGISVEVKNQARVHLWYEQRFGNPIPKLRSVQDGIDRYLILATCIGIEAASQTLYAPNGTTDLLNAILRKKPRTGNHARFLEKAMSYKSRWPWLTIIT